MDTKCICQSYHNNASIGPCYKFCDTLLKNGAHGAHFVMFCCDYALTHYPLDKMATILADDIFKCIFLNENDKIPIQISLKFAPRSPIVNKPTLVQVMAWHRIGDKPIPEPMMVQFTDAYMRH